MYLDTTGQVAGPIIAPGHDAGGRDGHEPIEAIFVRELRNPLLEPLGDSAVLAAGRRQLAFTTDSCVARPLFFPGGDIGELAVNGTINNLAVSGARPAALSAAVIVEDGTPLEDLQRIAGSMAGASLRAGVPIATGDTKVVERGSVDGVLINTSGVGCVEHPLDLSPAAIRPGDRVVVSGPIGDHGVAMMAARGELEAEVRSDTSPIHTLVSKLLRATDGVRWLRDPTRGGVAAALGAVGRSAQVGIAIEESELPVRPAVAAACEQIGLSPLSVANEGKVVAIVSQEGTGEAISVLRSHPLGREASVIGEVTPS